jgi:hypothetical protein
MDSIKPVSAAMSVIMKPPVYYFIVAVIIIKILLLKYISTDMLVIYRSLWFRIAFAILIAIIASYDYILATLLVACYVLAIQELNNRNIPIYSAAAAVSSNLAELGSLLDKVTNENITIPPVLVQPLKAVVQPLKAGNVEAAPSDSNKVNYMMKQPEVNDLINKINVEVDQSNIVPAVDSLKAIATSNPAFTTLTNNIMAKGFENLSLEQLNMPISNLVYGVDPDKPIKSSEDVLSAQGIDLKFPTGFDNTSVLTSKY